jgi:hypothetical protein
MTEKFTSIRIKGVSVYMARGYISYDDAIAEATRHYQHQLTKADAVLSAIRRREMQVYHQTGMYRARNRTEIMPENTPAANDIRACADHMVIGCPDCPGKSNTSPESLTCPDCGGNEFELFLGGQHSGQVACANCGLMFDTPDKTGASHDKT